MKKTLLSVTAALAVIGSACAAPSVEDRKALCEKYPDKYVWVAKDEMCVPINPCLSDNERMRHAYCDDLILFPFDISKRDLVVQRLVEKHGANVVSIKELSDLWFGVVTSDGNYWVGGRADGKQLDKFSAVDNAFYAHIYNVIPKTDENGTRYLVGVGRDMSPAECRDVLDFASLLFEDLLEGYYESEDSGCWIKVD